ncbi:MAG TPA: amino acid adenylation domain-containing protein, partial [Thermoanaerobaculia bacterium]|nr:amino acid adenylation domain-containing protein [Thermoanaerobaculia bacterium]
AEARRPFDLEQGPVLRVGLFRLAPGEHVLLALMHHIVSDDWSIWIFASELAALYEAFSCGRPSPLPALAIQYGDFAVWQRRWLEGPVLEGQLAWWRERLRLPLPVVDLPADRPRPPLQTFAGARLRRVVPPDLLESLRTLGRREGEASLFMVLLAAYDTLIHRYTGSPDVLVGSPIANRRRVEVEGLIGFFVNTLALRSDLSGDPGFRELLGRVREMLLGVYSHQDVPFERLVEELAPARDLSRNLLLDVFLVLGNAPRPPQELAPGVRLGLRELPVGIAKVDLSLFLEEGEEGLAGLWEHNTALFDRTTVERMAGHWEALLAGLAAAPEARLSELPLLTEDERRQVLGPFRESGRVEATLPVHELFAEWVRRTPDAPAVVFEGESLSYYELDLLANRLARRLRGLGVGPEVRVGIRIERSLSMIAAILGVLKAGGAYVPLDPELPSDRLDFMLADSGARVLVTEEDLAAVAGESGEPLPSEVVPESLAYVIYTSGSTGRPKGVMVEHGQLASYVAGVVERMELPPGSSYATVSTIAADLGNTVVFASLATGGVLHVIARERLTDGERMAELLERHPVDCVKIVPSHLLALLAADRPERVLPRRLVVVGGEASQWPLVDRVRSLVPGCRVLNHYGPTETTIGVLAYPTWTEVGAARRGTTVPLGYPLGGTRVLLADARLHPVPVGVPGELLAGGPQVTRGYLGRPDLTAERFIPDPHGSGDRLYRTGDLARYLPDGRVEFLGRIDHQVKIRGFRVEPGEVEAVLLAHSAVREALALARVSPGGEAR